jgi:hypothetical protein
MFFKKNKIKFYCELPEVKEKYPITPSGEYKFKWIRESAKAFKDIVAQKSAYEQITGVVKCPGVIPIMKQGYIVRSWFDLTITPLQDGRFECHIPQGIFSYLKERNLKVIDKYFDDVIKNFREQKRIATIRQPVQPLLIEDDSESESESVFGCQDKITATKGINIMLR